MFFKPYDQSNQLFNCMKYFSYIFLVTSLGFLFSCTGSRKNNEAAKKNARPNIVLIMADAEWKMVSLSGDTTWHLYKINQDQTELNDLAAAHSDVVGRLANLWREWADTHQVFPKPN
jgi:arylsulfatase